MPNNLDRFYGAVSVLCGHGHIKQRLVTAFMDNLEQIEEDDLPAAVKQPFVDLRSLMSQVAPLNGEGAIRASVRKMSIIEADECAQVMVDLYVQMLRFADLARASLPHQADKTAALPPFLVKSV